MVSRPRKEKAAAGGERAGSVCSDGGAAAGAAVSPELEALCAKEQELGVLRAVRYELENIRLMVDQVGAACTAMVWSVTCV